MEKKQQQKTTWSLTITAAIKAQSHQCFNGKMFCRNTLWNWKSFKPFICFCGNLVKCDKLSLFWASWLLTFQCFLLKEWKCENGPFNVCNLVHRCIELVPIATKLTRFLPVSKKVQNFIFSSDWLRLATILRTSQYREKTTQETGITDKC